MSDAELDAINAAIAGITERMADGTVGKTVTKDKEGNIITIMEERMGRRVITQYDKEGRITVSQILKDNDVVNFKDGYISSIIKYEEDSYSFAYGALGMNEIQYGENGRMLSSVHKVRIRDKSSFRNEPGSGKWMTTDKTTYYDNGHIAIHTTYKQRTQNTGRGNADSWYNSIHGTDRDETDVAESFVSSIEQMDESGKLLLSVQLHEFDEVNYHPTGRVASILRKDKDNNPKTMTSYDDMGRILNQMVYQDGKVISSVDYVDGKPVSNVQQGNEEYQNIFERAGERVKKQTKDKKAAVSPAPVKEHE